ncbi:MAG: hypothetical protein DA330_05540 [Nitrososphaera sp.]|nr:hypothetical protein [Nitrososphaera sp.]
MGTVFGLPMKTDISPGRIKAPAVKKKTLLAGMENQGFMISKMELRQYIERTDKQLGDYSLLTVYLETDKGNVEMKYDEGFRGQDAFESAVVLLTQYAGLASLINRALIELQS